MSTWEILAAILICTTALALVVLLMRALNYSFSITGCNRSERRRRLITIGGLLIGWIAYVSYLGISGIARQWDAMPPRLVLILPWPMLFLVFLMFRPGFSRILSVIPPVWLIAFQSFRIPVEIMLWMLYKGGHTPVQMTFEGMNMDILAGIFAIAAAAWMRIRPEHARKIMMGYNIFGLITLINIVTIAILSFPGPLRVFMNEPANTQVTYFPFILLPALLVPFAYYGHICSLKQLVILRKKETIASSDKVNTLLA